MALIQVLGKEGGVLIPESKSFHQAYEGPLSQPLRGKKIVQCAMCSPMACSRGSFHGNTKDIHWMWNGFVTPKCC
jgi:hypothetical protein